MIDKNIDIHGANVICPICRHQYLRHYSIGNVSRLTHDNSCFYLLTSSAMITRKKPVYCYCAYYGDTISEEYKEHA